MSTTGKIAKSLYQHFDALACRDGDGSSLSRSDLAAAACEGTEAGGAARIALTDGGIFTAGQAITGRDTLARAELGELARMWTGESLGPQSSDFQSGTEGWRRVDLKPANQPGGADYKNVLDVLSMRWQPQESGYIEVTDETGQSMFFDAPGRYLGDKSHFAGGALQFRLRSTCADYTEDNVVVLRGADGTTLVTEIATPGTDWTDYAISLRPEAFRFDNQAGRCPTAAELKNVLGNLSAVNIPAEWGFGSTKETTALDGVRFVHPDRLTDRVSLLEQIVANFETIKSAAGTATLFGVDDAQAIVAESQRFGEGLVAIAEAVENNQDLVDLADWTLPTSGVFSHDRANLRFEYQRALQVLQAREQLVPALDHLGAHFDHIAANGGGEQLSLDRGDVEAEAARLMNGDDAERAVARALKMVFDANNDGAAWAGPVDLYGLLANATGNNSGTGQAVTEDGIARLRAVITGGCQPETITEGPGRAALVKQVVQHFDVLAGAGSNDGVADNPTYVSVQDLKAIIDSTERYTPEVVGLARTLMSNRDLLEIADWHDLPAWYTKDLVTAKRQYLSVLGLMADRTRVDDALHYLLEQFDAIPRIGHHNWALTRADVEAHLATLASGTAGEQEIAAVLSQELRQEGVTWTIPFLTLLQSACGNNSGEEGVFTRAGIARLRTILNRAEG